MLRILKDHSTDDNSGEPCDKRNAKYEFIISCILITYCSRLYNISKCYCNIVYKITILYHVMTKLDLKDAYLSVPIHADSQKFLRFIWKDKTYQFQALPFGLNIAPRVFTRLLKPVAAFLRKRGVRLVIYLDNILIIGSSVEEIRQFTEMSLLESLGFIINKEKSIFTPTQIITFLGFTINSITM